MDIAEASVNWTNSTGAIISNDNTLTISDVMPSLHTILNCTAVLDSNPISCLPVRKTVTVDIKGINIFMIWTHCTCIH